MTRFPLMTVTAVLSLVQTGAMIGIAVVCGRTSRNLFVIDVDDPDVFERMKQEMRERQGDLKYDVAWTTLAALEADGAFPAIVVCPASLKLTWEREAGIWLPHRSQQILEGRSGAVQRKDITIVNYDIVDAHANAIGRLGPKALVLDESHYVKNPQAKQSQAVGALHAPRRFAPTRPPGGVSHSSRRSRSARLTELRETPRPPRLPASLFNSHNVPRRTSP